MKNSNFIEGIAIISKYVSPDGYNLIAEHDQIWFGSFNSVDESERDKLIELGWFENEESWSCFV